MLTFERHVAPTARDGAPLFVLLHGRGADRHDLIGLGDRLAPGSLLITPDGLHDARRWGYGPGRAWYQYLGDNRPEPESFEQSLGALEHFLASFSAHRPGRPGPLILGGFSQGGTLSLGYALTHTGQVPFVVIFSGFLPDHPRVKVRDDTVDGTAFFWGHGRHDQAVDHRWAVQGRALLRQAGADLEARDYAMGHTISDQELLDVDTWLQKRL